MQTNEVRFSHFSFTGRGSDLFIISIKNFLLTFITLGFYYPWARVEVLRYTTGNTTLDNAPFSFHGKGKELFIGYLKLVAILVAFYTALGIAFYLKEPVYLVAVYVVFLLGLAFLVPLAVHGALKYRTSKTTWKGIAFGYRGQAGDLVGIYVKGTFLTLITFGIYYAWFVVELSRYIIGNLRYGNATASYNGDGGDLFWLSLKGVLLTYITLGIYFPWYMASIYNYQARKTVITLGEGQAIFRSSLTGSDLLGLYIVNFLLFVFTLGIATPWIITRSMKLIASCFVIEGNVDFSAAVQTEAEYNDAFGTDALDALDLGIV